MTNISELTTTARTLGIELKHPADVQDLIDKAQAARELTTEPVDMIGALLNTEPKAWAKTIETLTAAEQRAKRVTDVKQALTYRIGKELPAVIRQHRDEYLCQFAAGIDIDALAAAARDLPTIDPAEAVRLRCGDALGNLLEIEKKITALTRLVATFDLRASRGNLTAATIVTPAGIRERIEYHGIPTDVMGRQIPFRAPVTRQITPDDDLARVKALRQIHSDLSSADPNTRLAGLVAAAGNADATIVVPTTTAEILATAEVWGNVTQAEVVTPANA